MVFLQLEEHFPPFWLKKLWLAKKLALVKKAQRCATNMTSSKRANIDVSLLWAHAHAPNKFISMTGTYVTYWYELKSAAS